MADEAKPPQVFISYSWTSEPHKKSVIEFAERLTGDGVHVVLDVWDLKKGQNVHKFMESMVTSEDIFKVLLVVDKEYQKKADEGRGGVGVETEIVSPHVYNHAKQDKFIPIVWERDEKGDPYLPAFLKARNYIDLSSSSKRDDYQDLLREIHNKPRYERPALGKTPTFLQEEKNLAVPGYFYDLKRSIENGDQGARRIATTAFFRGLAEQIATDLLLPNKGPAPTDDEVAEKIQTFHPLLEEFDKLFPRLLELGEVGLNQSLQKFFETCHHHYTFHSGGTYYETQFAPVQFVTQELILHVVAAFLKRENFNELNEFIDLGLVIERRTGNKELGSIFDLISGIMIIDRQRNDRLKMNRVSLVADMFKDRCTSKEISFDDLMEADATLQLRAAFTGGRWYPRALVYCDDWKKFELYLRAQRKTYFEKFKPVIAVTSKAELEKKCAEAGERITSIKLGSWNYVNLVVNCDLIKLGTL